MTPAAMILLFVAAQRGLELMYAARNTARLRQRGAVEFGRGHYPVMVVLHAAWLLSIAAGTMRDPIVRLFPLMIFAALQSLRIWVIATLGPFWTTRVLSVPGDPLVRRGPYRYMRHPNYLIVIGDIGALPLVFGQVANALIFSAINLVLIAWRVRIENAALAGRVRTSGSDIA